MKILHIGFVSCIFLTAICFPSCSKQLFSLPDTETGLRAAINQQNAQLDWTDERAPDGLPKPEVTASKSNSPVSLVLSNGEKIYPSLDGFGSLDNSLLPRALVKKIDTFFKALPEISDPDFLHPEHQYLPIFLRYNFSDPAHKIDRCLYGTPIISDSVYEIPLRLYSETAFMDILVFIVSGETFLLEQIQLGEWHE